MDTISPGPPYNFSPYDNVVSYVIYILKLIALVFFLRFVPNFIVCYVKKIIIKYADKLWTVGTNTIFDVLIFVIKSIVFVCSYFLEISWILFKATFTPIDANEKATIVKLEKVLPVAVNLEKVMANKVEKGHKNGKQKIPEKSILVNEMQETTAKHSPEKSMKKRHLKMHTAYDIFQKHMSNEHLQKASATDDSQIATTSESPQKAIKNQCIEIGTVNNVSQEVISNQLLQMDTANHSPHKATHNDHLQIVNVNELSQILPVSHLYQIATASDLLQTQFIKEPFKNGLNNKLKIVPEELQDVLETIDNEIQDLLETDHKTTSGNELQEKSKNESQNISDYDRNLLANKLGNVSTTQLKETLDNKLDVKDQQEQDIETPKKAKTELKSIQTITLRESLSISPTTKLEDVSSSEAQEESSESRKQPGNKFELETGADVYQLPIDENIDAELDFLHRHLLPYAVEEVIIKTDDLRLSESSSGQNGSRSSISNGSPRATFSEHDYDSGIEQTISDVWTPTNSVLAYFKMSPYSTPNNSSLMDNEEVFRDCLSKSLGDVYELYNNMTRRPIGIFGFRKLVFKMEVIENSIRPLYDVLAAREQDEFGDEMLVKIKCALDLLDILSRQQRELKENQTLIDKVYEIRSIIDAVVTTKGFDCNSYLTIIKDKVTSLNKNLKNFERFEDVALESSLRFRLRELHSKKLSFEDFAEKLREEHERFSDNVTTIVSKADEVEKEKFIKELEDIECMVQIDLLILSKFAEMNKTPELVNQFKDLHVKVKKLRLNFVEETNNYEPLRRLMNASETFLDQRNDKTHEELYIAILALRLMIANLPENTCSIKSRMWLDNSLGHYNEYLFERVNMIKYDMYWSDLEYHLYDMNNKYQAIRIVECFGKSQALATLKAMEDFVKNCQDVYYKFDWIEERFKFITIDHEELKLQREELTKKEQGARKRISVLKHEIEEEEDYSEEFFGFVERWKHLIHVDRQNLETSLFKLWKKDTMLYLENWQAFIQRYKNRSKVYIKSNTLLESITYNGKDIISKDISKYAHALFASIRSGKVRFSFVPSELNGTLLMSPLKDRSNDVAISPLPQSPLRDISNHKVLSFLPQSPAVQMEMDEEMIELCNSVNKMAFYDGVVEDMGETSEILDNFSENGSIEIQASALDDFEENKATILEKFENMAAGDKDALSSGNSSPHFKQEEEQSLNYQSPRSCEVEQDKKDVNESSDCNNTIKEALEEHLIIPVKRHKRNSSKDSPLKLHTRLNQPMDNSSPSILTRLLFASILTIKMCSTANKTIPLAHANIAINILKLLVEENEKEAHVISPTSLVIALSMVYAGAKEKTLEEMHKLLADKESCQGLHETLNGFLEEMIQNGNPAVQLLAANRVYIKEGFSLLQEFKDTITKYYYGEFKEINFNENVKAADEINTFVEDNTNRLIRNLIKADMLTSDTRLVLINALYFKGTWQKVFKQENTFEATFYGCHGQNKQVQMMQKTGLHLYASNRFYQFLMIPYVNGDTFMVIVLPKKKSNLLHLMESFTGTTYMNLTETASEHNVDIQLPKLKIESSWECNDVLKKLGMPTAFSEKADFSGITDQEPLVISKVIQKACIEVNESGTEAAAATAVMMMCKSCVMIKEEPIKFTADHPFMYFIVRPYHRILFAGIYQ
uniref:SERPIN domain-containing protein n=1 Tax=Rhabditophanes sp. KR3021 TaxID=114890 RepID=A0AC35TS27_9BILA